MILKGIVNVLNSQFGGRRALTLCCFVIVKIFDFEVLINMHYIFSVQERELLGELAVLSTTKANRTRPRPQPRAAGEDFLSYI